MRKLVLPTVLIAIIPAAFSLACQGEIIEHETDAELVEPEKRAEISRPCPQCSKCEIPLEPAGPPVYACNNSLIDCDVRGKVLGIDSVVLDPQTGPNLSDLRLAGIRIRLAPDRDTCKVAPSESPLAEEIFISLPELRFDRLWEFDLDEGATLCGSVGRMSVGYMVDAPHAELSDQRGVVLVDTHKISWDRDTPMTAFDTPFGWSFHRGQWSVRKRNTLDECEQCLLTEYEVEATHNGVTCRTTECENFPDGNYLIKASAFSYSGHLPVWVTRSGMSARVVRVREHQSNDNAL